MKGEKYEHVGSDVPPERLDVSHFFQRCVEFTHGIVNVCLVYAGATSHKGPLTLERERKSWDITYQLL